jgi:hypothetical protein
MWMWMWGFFRQVYREFGWPDAFRVEEAMRVVDELVASMEERGEWEVPLPGWWLE